MLCPSHLWHRARRALVTGGLRGLGFAVAQRLASTKRPRRFNSLIFSRLKFPDWDPSLSQQSASFERCKIVQVSSVQWPCIPLSFFMRGVRGPTRIPGWARPVIGRGVGRRYAYSKDTRICTDTAKEIHNVSSNNLTIAVQKTAGLVTLRRMSTTSYII